MSLEIKNKKVFHDYTIIETYEAGIVLKGTEIKSIRNSKANIKESYIRFIHDELFIINMHIAKYEQGNRFNHEEIRDRKLLLSRAELSKIKKMITLNSYTIVPIKLYIKSGYAKLEIGVAQGKKNYDKRQALKEKDANMKIKKAIKMKY